MEPSGQPSAAHLFQSHLHRASEIYCGRAGEAWTVADALVLEAARIAVEERWMASVVWKAFADVTPDENPERLIIALARVKAEKAKADGSLGSSGFERVLSIFEDAERVDMLAVKETAFAPELTPTH